MGLGRINGAAALLLAAGLGVCACGGPERTVEISEGRFHVLILYEGEAVLESFRWNHEHPRVEIQKGCQGSPGTGGVKILDAEGEVVVPEFFAQAVAEDAPGPWEVVFRSSYLWGSCWIEMKPMPEEDP